jgi:Major tropism determinant N-terminal domain
MTIIRLKRGSAADWQAADPVLDDGEEGFERDTGLVKVGDGVRHWSELPYTGNGDIERYHGVKTVTTLSRLTPSAITNQFNITALSSTLAITNPVPDEILNGQNLVIRIKDDGVPRTITWDTYYRPVGVILPTITVVGKILYLGAKWNADETKFDVIAVGIAA